MGFAFFYLDAGTRKAMLDEINTDIAHGALYLSRFLSDRGVEDYPQLLKDAVSAHDDSWLADELRKFDRLDATAERRNRSGSVSTVRVPVIAPEMLAEREFNRFYLRVLCLRAITRGIPQLVIYRDKAVANPRPEADLLIGTAIDAAALLADLRANLEIDAALGVPRGPNSGLSARLP